MRTLLQLVLMVALAATGLSWTPAAMACCASGAVKTVRPASAMDMPEHAQCEAAHEGAAVAAGCVHTLCAPTLAPWQVVQALDAPPLNIAPQMLVAGAVVPLPAVNDSASAYGAPRSNPGLFSSTPLPLRV